MVPEASNNQLFISRLTKIVSSHLHEENFGVNELASEMRMSRATLHRKVKALGKDSVSTFIRELRLKRAYELLQNTSGTVSEIGYHVGFGSTPYFNRAFRNFYGFPPGEVLKGLHLPEKDLLPENSKTGNVKSQSGIRLYISFAIVFALLLVFGLRNYYYNHKQADTTIVVFPFDNFVQDARETYIIAGLREEIVNRLSLISNFKVVSGTIPDNYEDSGKSIPEISRKLGADYIIKGSIQAIEDEMCLRIQLIEAKSEKHLWSETYRREIEGEKIFDIHEDVAISVASELKTEISSSEKKLITSRPTGNVAAFRLYLQGLTYMNLYEQDRKKIHFYNAKDVFEKAVRIDSTFADAYLQLADIYINDLAWTYNYKGWKVYFLYLDSGLVMIEKAKKNGTSDFRKAFRLEADYFQSKGMYEEALSSFEKAWKNKERNFEYYKARSNFHGDNEEYFGSLKNFYLYLKIKPDTVLVNQDILLQAIANLIFTGFPNAAKNYAAELFSQHNDTLRHKNLLWQISFYTGDYKSTKSEILALYNLDTTNLFYISHLMDINIYLRDYPQAIRYLNKLHEGDVYISQDHQLDVIEGFLYLMQGYQEKADERFNREIEILTEQINLNAPFAQGLMAHARLAGVYSILGNKQLAINHLGVSSKRNTIPLYMIEHINALPVYDNIRDEPEFKKIMDVMKTKFIFEHNRVYKLLKRKGIEPS